MIEQTRWRCNNQYKKSPGKEHAEKQLTGKWQIAGMN
jgi:hypothetical protein